MNFSFQNELTFAPKLNSLSLKLAGVNRTSLLERTPKKKNTTLDSSYTFQPVLSNNSSKIVAKLKTGFWERQKLHAKRQQEKVSFCLLLFLPFNLFTFLSYSNGISQLHHMKNLKKECTD